LPRRLSAGGHDSPDIVSLNYFDYPKQIKQENLLMDLFTLFAGDDEMSVNRVLPGVVSAMTDESGAMYTLPMSFTTRMLTRSNHNIDMLTAFDERPDRWEWMDLPHHFDREVGEEEHQAEYLLPYPPDMLLHSLLSKCYPLFYEYNNRRYNVDTPVLREILRTVRYYYERGLIPDYDSEINWGNYWETDALFILYGTRGDIADYTSFNLTTNILGDSVVTYPQPMIRGAEGMSIQLYDEYAISAKAPNKTAAWEFIKILFSDEVQNGEGIIIQPVIADLSVEAVERATGNPGLTPEEVFAYNNERVAFFSGINRVRVMDSSEILWFVVYNSRSYIEGERDLDSIIEYLQLRSEYISPP
jgi:hypothetical protein